MQYVIFPTARVYHLVEDGADETLCGREVERGELKQDESAMDSSSRKCQRCIRIHESGGGGRPLNVWMSYNEMSMVDDMQEVLELDSRSAVVKKALRELADELETEGVQ